MLRVPRTLWISTCLEESVLARLAHEFSSAFKVLKARSQLVHARSLVRGRKLFERFIQFIALHLWQGPRADCCSLRLGLALSLRSFKAIMLGLNMG